jgi:hypothetical protein
MTLSEAVDTGQGFHEYCGHLLSGQIDTTLEYDHAGSRTPDILKGWLAISDPEVLGQGDPTTPGNIWKPVLIRGARCEMIRMDLYTRTSSPQSLCNDMLPKALIEEEGSLFKPLSQKEARNVWLLGSLRSCGRSPLQDPPVAPLL